MAVSLTSTSKLLPTFQFYNFRNTKPLKPRFTLSTASSSSSPPPPPLTVSEPETGNSVPCIRTYENDLARLSLTGFVEFDQAVTAASADGGQVATEHVVAGLDVMVVETVLPAPADDRSTMSTRLFLPAREVKAKGRKFRSSLPKDIFSGASSKKILEMTFRQVVVQQLLNFNLAVFVPGSQRNIEDLGSQRDVSVSFALSSSNEDVISGLAEAVCILALETTQSEFQHGQRGKGPDSFFNWFSKTKKFASKDSSVILYKFEDEVIVENAKSLLDIFNSSREIYTKGNTKPTVSVWPSAMHSKLEKIGGFEFSKWTSENVPAYRLVINADRLTNITFEGWKETSENKREILLTHSQMVALADILDMYFEDAYTLPSKQLSYGKVRSPKNLLQNKSRFSLLGFVRTTLVTAIFLVSVGVIIKLFLPHVCNSRRRNDGEYHAPSSSENYCETVHPKTLETSQLEEYCCALVRKLKDFYGWNGDVNFEPSVGARIGEIPASLKNGHVADLLGQDVSASLDTFATSDDALKSSIQEIASYQVVMSTDGRVVGFQPTSRVAVNHWAANPIAKELYGGRKLLPGLLEPGLKIKKPENVIVLELLMSQNQDNSFALARLLQ